MKTSNYTTLEEELISTHLQNVLHKLKIYNLISNRIGLEMSMQNGKICASNLNFYKTKADELGNINCLVHPLSEDDKNEIKISLGHIFQILNMRIPSDMFGHIELIAEYDPHARMRVRNLMLNIRSTFRLAV